MQPPNFTSRDLEFADGTGSSRISIDDKLHLNSPLNCPNLITMAAGVSSFAQLPPSHRVGASTVIVRGAEAVVLHQARPKLSPHSLPIIANISSL
jgi:hypothetical protein